MSDNVAIKEGARAYNFTTDKIRTAQQNSDEPVIWVPESTVRLGSLRASDNGVYLARSEELYGFNEIVVSINGAATIGDRAVFPDDSGELHEENLPHDIVIFRPPKKLVYSDGEKINLGGIVVMAMDADGNVWTNARYPDGRIPLGELRINPPNADAEQATDAERDVSGTNLIAPVYLVPLKVGMYYQDLKIHSITGSPYGFGIGDAGRGEDMVVSYEPSSVTVARENGSYPVTYRANVLFEYNGKHCYIQAHYSLGPCRSDIPRSANQYIPHAQGVALLGTTPMNPQQTITLSWARYGDGAVLSTSFNITVTTDDGFSGGSGKF